MTARRGFTLTEIAVSMLVFAVAILTVLALLPTGYRAQSVSRQQVFAAGLAVTLMESFHHPINTSTASIGEGYANLFNSGSRAALVGRGQPANWKTGAFSPSRGWAWFQRETLPPESITAHDFERVLCNRINGLIPVPDLIARRIDSDGDEIKRILDEGGKLYYLDPGTVRGLKWGHKFDLGKTDSTKGFRSDPEIHRIVIAVAGHPQQNAMLLDPLEVWPWYELYPFPPNWCKGRGMQEFRKWRVGTANAAPAASIRNMSGNDVNIILRYDDGTSHRTYTTGAEPIMDASGGPPANASPWSEAGWLGQHWGSRVRLAMRRIDAGDPTTGDERLWMSSPHAAGTNDEVWQAFRRLAIGDEDRTDDTTDLVPGAPGGGAYTPGIALDDVDGIGDGGFDGQSGWIPVTATTSTSSGYTANPDVDGDGDVDNYDRDRTQAPGRTSIQPTYETRASYRDRAIALWNSVRPQGYPELQRQAFALPKPAGVTLDAGNRLSVGSVLRDPEQYEYPPSELAKFALLDPAALIGTSFGGRSQYPPHPAQVLALSFLAHSAMTVAGRRPPFRQPYPAVEEAYKGTPDVPLYDTFDPVYTVRFSGWSANTYYPKGTIITVGSNDYLCISAGVSLNAGGGPSGTAASISDNTATWSYLGVTDSPMDVKIVAADAGSGATTVQLLNDRETTIVLYDGDFLWFKDDPDNVHEVDCAAPVVILPTVPPAAPSPVNVTIGASYAASDRGYTPLGAPGLGAVVRANSQAIRVANLTDLAFARITHEMCLRWVMAYSRESNLDWGAPRPANQMLATDRPLALQDLWFDAGPLAGDPLKYNNPEGQAQRRVSNPPMGQFSAGAETPWYQRESFYRWTYPRNPLGGDPVTGNANRPGNFGVKLAKHIRADVDEEDITRSFINGIASEKAKYYYNAGAPAVLNPKAVGWRLTDWLQMDAFWSMWHNRHLREPSAGADAQRYWLDRPFDPSHRTRELVFWSCDWKQYEDAESAPSAVVDMGRVNTYPSRTNGGRIDSMSRLGFATNYYAGNFIFEHPEGWLIWADANRATTCEAFQNGSSNPSTLDDNDKVFGHYGADRNANGRYDRGPVPTSSRMRAVGLVRISFYDPVMPLHAGN